MAADLDALNVGHQQGGRLGTGGHSQALTVPPGWPRQRLQHGRCLPRGQLHSFPTGRKARLDLSKAL